MVKSPSQMILRKPSKRHLVIAQQHLAYSEMTGSFLSKLFCLIVIIPFRLTQIMAFVVMQKN